MQSLKKEENEKIQTKWDSMALTYEKSSEMINIQGTITCAIMTNMIEQNRVLEVGCGPGRHSLHLA